MILEVTFGILLAIAILIAAVFALPYILTILTSRVIWAVAAAFISTLAIVAGAGMGVLFLIAKRPSDPLVFTISGMGLLLLFILGSTVFETVKRKGLSRAELLQELADHWVTPFLLLLASGLFFVPILFQLLVRRADVEVAILIPSTLLGLVFLGHAFLRFRS